MQDEYTTEYGVSGTAYGFVAAPPPKSESRTMDNGEAHNRFRPLLIPLLLLVAYLLFHWQFDQPVVNEVGLPGVVVVATVVGVLPLFLRWGPAREGGRIIGGMLLLGFFLLGMISLYALFSWTVSAVPAASVETVGGAGAAVAGTLFLILRFTMSRWLSLDKWNRRE